MESRLQGDQGGSGGKNQEATTIGQVENRSSGKSGSGGK